MWSVLEISSAALGSKTPFSCFSSPSWVLSPRHLFSALKLWRDDLFTLVSNALDFKNKIFFFEIFVIDQVMREQN